MIIYHVITTFHLLSCLVHKIYFHETEKAVLVIPDFMQDKIEIDRFNELIDLKIFNQIIVFPYRKLGGTYDQIVKNSLRVFDELFSQMKLSEQKIYVYGAHFYFTIGLVNHRIGYEVFEEASGGYTHQNILIDAVRSSNPVMEKVCTAFQTLSYKNEYIKKVWIDYEAQEGKFDKNDTIHYSMMDCLGEIANEKRQKLYTFFRVPQINVDSDAALVLTQHFMNLNILAYDEQIELYKTYIDSFLSNRDIYIKPHPDDFMDYESHLKKCKIIKGRFPIELLAIRKSPKLSTIATVYSTAIYTVNKLFEDTICLDMNYRDTYRHFYHYFVSIKIVEKLFADQSNWICQGVGIDYRMFTELLKHRSNQQVDIYNLENGILSGRSIYFIGVYSEQIDKENSVHEILDNMTEKDVIVFLNTDEKALSCLNRKKHYADGIIPIKISINTKDYDIWDQREIVMYIYAKERELREQMKNLNIHEEFSNLETILDVEPMSEEQIRIKVLEGMLRATEERLLAELNKDKEKSEEER